MRFHVLLGTIPFYHDNKGEFPIAVYVTIEYMNGALSIDGVEGPQSNGNCYGSCGQICMHIDDAYLDTMKFAPGMDRSKVEKLLQIWKRWHLNDTRAGTPEQEEYLRKIKSNGDVYHWNVNESHYEWATKKLNDAGLNPVKIGDINYHYGHAWLYEPVPQDVLDFLFTLPPSYSVPPRWRK